MQEKWKSFVYPLIEDRKQDVEEVSYSVKKTADYCWRGPLLG